MQITQNSENNAQVAQNTVQSSEQLHIVNNPIGCLSGAEFIYINEQNASFTETEENGQQSESEAAGQSKLDNDKSKRKSAEENYSEDSTKFDTSKDESRLSLNSDKYVKDYTSFKVGNIENDDKKFDCQISDSPDCDIKEESDENISIIKIEEPLDNKLLLEKGMTFDNYNEFWDHFERWEFQNLTHTFKHNSRPNTESTGDNYKYNFKHLRCVHYGKPRVGKSSNKRPNQSYMAKGCLFQLVVKLDKDLNKYYIDSFHAEHKNHEVSKSSYMNHPNARKLTNADLKKYVHEYLIDLKIPKSTIKDRIQKETGKFITSKDLQNYKEKEARNAGAGGSLCVALKFLENEQQEHPGSEFNIAYSEDNIVKTIFWESKEMKEVFENNPSVVLVDGTYNCTNAGYVLVNFTAIDNHKKSYLVAWCLISNERKETLEGALELFKDANSQVINQVEYIVVDKDFSEIAALSTILPSAEFIICRFHALDAIAKKIHSLRIDKEHAASLTAAVHKMVFSPNLDDYNANWEKIINFEPMTPEIKRFADYFDVNWHCHRQHFALHLIKSKKLYESFTNNRAENTNMNVKRNIKKRSPIDVVVKELVKFSKLQGRQLGSEDWSINNKTFLPTDIGSDRYKEEIVTLGNEFLLSKKVLGDILTQYNLSKSLNDRQVCLDRGQTICSRIKTGLCTFSSSNGLPCKHLLFVRKYNNERMLEVDMIEDKWMRQANLKGRREPTKSKILRKMPTAMKRNNESKPIIRDLTNLLQSCDNTSRDNKLDVLEALSAKWKNGSSPEQDNNTDSNSTNVDMADSVKREKTTNNVTFTDLKLSPHKRCHLSNQGMTKTIKKRKTIPLQSSSNPLLPWMKECNKNFEQILNKNNWGRMEFDILTDMNLRGGSLFLTDNHLEWAGALILSKFPDLKGFLSPCLYHARGFSPIETGKTFIQPIYGGGSHWVTLENCEIPADKRATEITLYDSLLKFKKGSKTQFKINPAIVWQSAQLLKSNNHDERTPRIIFINVKPCHQQAPNLTDCGLFAIANACSLSFGMKPEELEYTGNMRRELINMVKSMEITMFKHVKKSGNQCDQSKFKLLTTVGRILDNIPIKTMRARIELICHCQLPESYGHIITCDSCQFDYHLGCYLITKASMKDHKYFFCYNCRKPGQYSFLQVSCKPDSKAIAEFIEKLEKQQTFRMSRYITDVLSFHNRKATATKEQMLNMFNIYVKYDMSMACQKLGPLYNAFYNVYYNNQSEMPRKYDIDRFTRAQLIHLLLQLICDYENIDCPPIYYAKVTTQGKSEYENVHANNKNWLLKLISHSVEISDKVGKLCSSTYDVEEVIEAVSTFNKELEGMDNYAFEMMTLYENAALSDDFPKKLSSEKETVFNDISLVFSRVQDCTFKLKQYQDKVFDM
jgi:hypothetical protein